MVNAKILSWGQVSRIFELQFLKMHPDATSSITQTHFHQLIHITLEIYLAQTTLQIYMNSIVLVSFHVQLPL